MHTVTLAAFLRKHWVTCQSWPRESLLGWVRWFQLRDLAVWHCDERGRIDAVCLGRPVLSVAMAENQWHYATGASIWWIDVLVMTGSKDWGTVMRSFFRQGRLRLGAPSQIAWERWTRHRGGRAWPIGAMLRRMRFARAEPQMLLTKH